MTSWPTVKLGEVATIDRAGVDPRSLDGNTPYLGLEHIASGGELIGQDTVRNADAKSTKFHFTPEHVLFGKLRPYLAKVTLPKFVGICSTDILPLRPNERLDRKYLAYFLLSPEIVNWASTRTTGANLPRLSPNVLATLPIPLPPLAEQRRIAEILDRADAIRTKRRQLLAHLDTLTQAVFHEMFGDPGKWSARWPMGTVGEMAESVQYGTSAKAGDSGTWPILRMGNITDDGRLDLADLKYIDLKSTDETKYTVSRGDLLFNRTNSKEKVGKSAVVETDETYAYAGYLVRVRIKPAHHAKFVSTYLSSPHGIALRRLMAKEAVNQANINATELRKIAIALPPTNVQHQFAARAEAISAQRRLVEQALARDDELFAALQSRAFRGEL